MNYYKNRSKAIKGDGVKRTQRGKGAFFLMMLKKCCKS